MRNKLIVISFFSLMILLFLTPHIISAKEFYFVPSISTRGTYDSNVFFSFNDKDDDFFITFRPEAKLQYDTELFSLEALGRIDIDRYSNESELDDEKYRLELNADHKFLPRWTASAILLFIQDNTFDTELIETGRVTDRERRRRYDAGGGLAYQVSELSDIGLDVRFSKKEYEERGQDTDVVSLIFDYNRKLKNQRDIISIIPFYRYRDNDVAELNVIGSALGWEHPFSETLVLNSRAGLHYWNQDLKEDDDQDTGLGPVADINLEKSGELFSARLGYRRDIRTPRSGRFVYVDRFYTRLGKRITERLSTGFIGSIYFTLADLLAMRLGASIFTKMTGPTDIPLQLRRRFKSDTNRATGATASP